MIKRVLLLMLAMSSLALRANELKTVDIPSDFGKSGGFTVACWAYIPSELGRVDGNGFGVKGFSFVSRGNYQTGVQFYIGTNQGIPEFKFYIPAKGWLGILKSGECLRCGSRLIERQDLPKIVSDEWFHIAGVRDGNRMALYVNGEKIGECHSLPPAPATDGPVSLCALKEAPAYWNFRFPGYVEKCSFLDRALSDDEVVNLLSGGVFLPEKMPSIRPFPKPVLKENLSSVKVWEKKSRPAPPEGGNCVARVVIRGGRPRLELNGEIVDATQAIPSMVMSYETKAATLLDFASAGVRFISDVWFSYTKKNNWWLAPGKYDFEALDRHFNTLLDVSPEFYIMPRFKLDPPEWWREQNPDEMLAGYVNPASEKWRALFERMLRDVVSHVESSPYACRVYGYNFGAMVGSEWISRRTDTPKDYNPDYWKERADATSGAALRAARIIKEITGGNKLAGVFFGYPLAEHGNLMQLVVSPDIDFFCSPIGYNGRRAGEPGRFSTPYQGTYRVHGKLYWSEADERTHISEYTGLWHPSWHQQTPEETRGAMMRDLAWALTSGHEIWWFTIAGAECFHDEGIINTVREGVEMARNRPDRPRCSEIAVFSPVWYAPDPAEKRNKETKSGFLNYVVPTCGVPIDSYELADLSNPDLPKYKAAIVITGTHGYMPEPADREMKLLVVDNEKNLPKSSEELREWCRKNGAHVWCETEDTFGAGCGFAFIHAASSGKKKVAFPSGKVWKGKMEYGETKILRY